VTCGGNFSQTEFDTLEKKKQETRAKCRQGRKMMVVFARQLIKQEQQVANLEKKLADLSRRQDLMLDREARVLGELDAEASSSREPDLEVMGFEDDFFLMDDPNLISDPLNLSSVGLSWDPSFSDTSQAGFIGDSG